MLDREAPRQVLIHAEPTALLSSESLRDGADFAEGVIKPSPYV